MPRQLRDGTTGGPRQWSRTAQTQRALLDAARQVFTERGFSDASIADIVERAGSSVGSLYHHFGGKSELFVALWQQHQVAHEEAASKAVADARNKGITDPGQLFETGARAFLHGSWQRRDLTLLFNSGDAPPGFDMMRRRRGREWIGQNDSLLRLTDRPEDRVYAAILTSLIGEGAYEVAAARTRRQAEKIIDAVTEYARRLMAGGPWHPGNEPPSIGTALDISRRDRRSPSEYRLARSQAGRYPLTVGVWDWRYLPGGAGVGTLGGIFPFSVNTLRGS